MVLNPSLGDEKMKPSVCALWGENIEHLVTQLRVEKQKYEKKN